MRDDPLRRRAAAIAKGAFLRVDLKDALYIVAARDKAPFEEAGFRAKSRGALLALYPTAALLPPAREAFLEAGDGDWLFALLELRRDFPVSEDELALFSEGIKLFCGRAQKISDYDKKLRQTAARCLREGYGGALSVCRLIYLAAGAAQNTQIIKTRTKEAYKL